MGAAITPTTGTPISPRYFFRILIAPVPTTVFWEWLGKSLNAFFGDESDPVPASGLSDDFQELIQHHSQYIALSALIFPIVSPHIAGVATKKAGVAVGMN